MELSSRERVWAALHIEEPDRVPYCELGIDRALANRLMGWTAPADPPGSLEVNPYSVEEAKALAERLHLDNIYYVLRAPIYAHRHAGQDGRLFYAQGMVKSEDDLHLLRLPDPYDDRLYDGARRFVQNKDGYSLWLITRIGIFPTMLSLGIENFCLALRDNLPFVETVLDRYFDWTTAVAERVCQMDFDAFVTTDDMAFKSSTFFSPQIFQDLLIPRYRRVAEKITIPWLVHSDGNLTPFVDYLIGLGITGLHPNEKGAMDIRAMKRDYGDRLCLLGNVDLNLLGMGPPEDVEREVFELIRDIGPGGGYIVSSGNSLASYCLPENVVALSQAVQKHGRYPLS